MTTNHEMLSPQGRDQHKLILEFAAKAAGIEITAIVDKGIPRIFSGGYWNPLTSSADCAAMCAKLMIDTLWTDDYVVCGDDSRTYESEIQLDDNPEAAWRYAATMVAANIGGMK